MREVGRLERRELDVRAPENPFAMRAMDRNEKHEPRRRQALWEAYGRRCAYSGEPISCAEDVQIDHVLPRWLVNDPAERKRILAEFDRRPDFQILNNLLNFVPTTAAFNIAKGAKTEKSERVANLSRRYLRYRPYEDRARAWEKPADELIRHGLALAVQNRAAVERRERELETIEHLHECLSKIPSEQHEELPILLDEVVGGAEPFPVRVDLESVPAQISRGAALLSCRFSTDGDSGGTSLLQFKRLQIRDAMISFERRELLATLFRGFGGVPEGDRPFIMAPHEDGYYVQMQHVTFWLRCDEVRDLCAVVEAAAPEFLLASERVERKWRSLPLRQATRGYRLCEVDLPVWAECLRYACGETVADTSNAMHRVLLVRDGPGGREGQIVARLHAEPDDWNLRVSVCWDPLAEAQSRREGGAEPWNAEQVQAWLDEQVFPSILGRHGPRPSRLATLLRRGVPRERGTSAQGLRTVSHLHEWKQKTGFESSGATRSALLEMIGHYSHARRCGGMPAELVRSIYAFIADFVKRNAVSGERRAAVARALPSAETSADLDATLEAVTTAASPPCFVDGYVVHHALGALLELLGGSHGFDMSDRERDEAASALDGVYQYTRSRAYLERLIARQW
jgi:hypothetical protein